MTMRSDSPIYILATQLRKATEEGRAQWQLSDRPDAFTYTGTEAAVVLSSKDRDGIAPFTMTLLGGDGTTAEEVSSDMEWSERDAEYFLAKTEWNNLLEDLYVVARRSALNIDKLVKSLIDEIRRDGPF